MSQISIGILGFGYLGKHLANFSDWSQNSWATNQSAHENKKVGDSRFELLEFSWDIQPSWSNLPNIPSCLVLTIPPQIEDERLEQERLSEWCQWMVKNRPQYKKLVYISSTGVYPNKAGTWEESSDFRPDSLKGKLRFISEKTLSDYWDTKVIRSGAIYGSGRNIGVRILNGKAIPQGSQPIHRIHVEDLANICRMSIVEDNFPKILNAVDLLPATSMAAAQWLIKQPFFEKNGKTEIKEAGFHTRKFGLSEPERKISGKLLADKLGYQFLHPTYKDGLKASFE